MSSSLRDSKYILDDEQDLLKLEQTFKQLQAIKDDKARQEQTIAQLRANLEILKNDNQLLRRTSPKRSFGNKSIPQGHCDFDRHKAKQVGRLKKLHQKEDRENFSAEHTYKQSMLAAYPIGRLVGEDSHAQTKRKVINGFVDEMALELQRNSQILATERQAHQEDRLALQNAEKQIVLLRSQLKMAEDSADSVYRENDFLKSQLAQQKSIRMGLEGELMSKADTIDRYEKLFFRNSRAYDSQLQKISKACLGLQREIGL